MSGYSLFAAIIFVLALGAVAGYAIVGLVLAISDPVKGRLRD